MRQVRILRPHPLAQLLMDDLLEPPQGACSCTHPDIQPLGGWWPASFTCCRTCQRPVL